ncbi:MarC family protein [Parasutterella sp.]|uniref:MarC family protein n=1 Tax=Parasutterella sp. TaxID=2049037 RepID=UPI003520BC58
MLSSFLSTFLYVFTSLVTVVNPIGAAMFFLTITSGATRAQRMTLSNKVCIYFLIMALVTLCAGSFVLSFFWDFSRSSSSRWRPDSFFCRMVGFE